MRQKAKLRLILLIPVFVYIASYFYLAYYHGKIFILDTIIHENGRFTLLQTIFYMPHFLGQIPVYTMVSFLFVGFYLSLSVKDSYSWKRICTFLGLLFTLLVSALLMSSIYFGPEETISFMIQQKQGEGIYAQGGSWNLHLPSSIMLFWLIPLNIYAFKKIFKKTIYLNTSGLFYLFSGLLMFFLYTYFLNINQLNAILLILKDPRYLAHGVRELLTFLLIYFPIPLYFIMSKDKDMTGLRENTVSKGLKYSILSSALILSIGILYISYLPLTIGIGNLAQKPFFAKGGHLSIIYLLTSHYFEHLIDTLYFAFFCLFLYHLSLPKRTSTAETE